MSETKQTQNNRPSTPRNGRNNNGGKKRYYKKKKPTTNNNSRPTQETPKEIKMPKVRSYKPNHKKPVTFGEIQYSDKITMLLGGVTLLASLIMWFMGKTEEAIYLGIWVPGVFAASSFIRLSYTRAKRK